MDRIKQVFSSSKKIFIPYITAGYPSVKATVEILDILVDNGADIIELGFPFSDPTADGPTIQESSQRALEDGFKRDDYFTILERFRSRHSSTPIVVFCYFNPVFHYGVEAYVQKVKQLGGDAFLIVDLPLEEQAEVRLALDKFSMHLIQLIAPTTESKRVQNILAQATGFVYQISVRGVTGTRDLLDSGIVENVSRVRGMTELPVVVGFGISRADQIEKVLPGADGIVVGSALVKVIHDNLPDFHGPLKKKVQELADAVHRSV